MADRIPIPLEIPRDPRDPGFPISIHIPTSYLLWEISSVMLFCNVVHICQACRTKKNFGAECRHDIRPSVCSVVERPMRWQLKCTASQAAITRDACYLLDVNHVRWHSPLTFWTANWITGYFCSEKCLHRISGFLRRVVLRRLGVSTEDGQTDGWMVKIRRTRARQCNKRCTFMDQRVECIWLCTKLDTAGGYAFDPRNPPRRSSIDSVVTSFPFFSPFGASESLRSSKTCLPLS